ncbi:MAG: glycosyltransferase 87 family protein, partial [Solirubrobacteraceae bacterium]
SPARTWKRFQYPLAVYAASRLLYVLVAVTDSIAQHTSIGAELSNWDGQWYIRTAEHWYSHQVIVQHEHYTTLGFLPLFPTLQWLIAHITPLSVTSSGVALSLISGAVATLLVMKLAEEWWGKAAARRALWFWCFFPGTVVFTMVYTEGLLISLVAGSLLLLTRKRWVWAGLLAGLSTAVEPLAVAVIPACAAAAWMEIRKHGWEDRQARRSLLAPILSPLGLVGFGIFLWFWCGTPLASYEAQRGAWSQSPSPLAIPRLFGSLVHQLFIKGVGSHGPAGIDLNAILGLLGTAFLFYGLSRLWRVRRTVPVPAWTWTACATLLLLTTKNPPNPRMLICTFPVVLIVGAGHRGRARWWLLAADIACLLVLSWFTYVGIWLRP